MLGGPGDHRARISQPHSGGKLSILWIATIAPPSSYACRSRQCQTAQATEEADLKRFLTMKPGKRKTHAAMTVSMDDAVGKLLASLHAHDLEKNTLIIFISDNGGFRAIASRNTPLRGPSGTSSRAASRPLRHAMDRTHSCRQGLREVGQRLGYPCPPPSWPQAPPQTPLWRSSTASTSCPSLMAPTKGTRTRPSTGASASKAIRHGNWKMIDRALKRPALFDLSEDIGESTNLAGRDDGRTQN